MVDNEPVLFEVLDISTKVRETYYMGQQTI